MPGRELHLLEDLEETEEAQDQLDLDAMRLELTQERSQPLQKIRILENKAEFHVDQADLLDDLLNFDGAQNQQVAENTARDLYDEDDLLEGPAQPSQHQIGSLRLQLVNHEMNNQTQLSALRVKILHQLVSDQSYTNFEKSRERNLQKMDTEGLNLEKLGSNNLGDGLEDDDFDLPKNMNKEPSQPPAPPQKEEAPGLLGDLLDMNFEASAEQKAPGEQIPDS